jgi:hypothetical protein
MRMSRTEFEALQAAQRRKLTGKLDSPPAEGCDNESKLHAEIINECKLRGWIVFHGSMAHATFRTPGEPDFILLAANPPRTFLIEAKTRTGKLSPDQQAIHHWAARLGHKIHVVRSLSEFLEVIS